METGDNAMTDYLDAAEKIAKIWEVLVAFVGMIGGGFLWTWRLHQRRGKRIQKLEQQNTIIIAELQKMNTKTSELELNLKSTVSQVSAINSDMADKINNSIKPLASRKDVSDSEERLCLQISRIGDQVFELARHG